MPVAHLSSRVVTAPHPGTILRDHVLPGLCLTISQAALELGVSRQTLHRLLDGSSANTPGTATRLARLSGVPSMFWLRLQCEYDLQRAHASLANILPAIPSHSLPQEILNQLGAIDAH
ncbi:HigA family addiction module antitoxin [Paraburkholderia sacchari]|uniref:HigA family addiction module antitoxin n=1 Tax=Paraburkholderia sacchari TaxID=159450 RepID=UPI000541E451|nr:HigA family addiction module antitoxin [Paraburkholderia sacchari]NLP65144.1 HigA family addiction module antidote protein [Paraburkholderia sacchari]